MGRVIEPRVGVLGCVYSDTTRLSIESTPPPPHTSNECQAHPFPNIDHVKRFIQRNAHIRSAIETESGTDKLIGKGGEIVRKAHPQIVIGIQPRKLRLCAAV